MGVGSASLGRPPAGWGVCFWERGCAGGLGEGEGGGGGGGGSDRESVRELKRDKAVSNVTNVF